MKLLYIFLGGSEKGSSVQSKITNQIQALRFHGVEAEGWFFSPTVKEARMLDAHITLYPLSDEVPARKYFDSHYRVQDYYRQIREKLNADGAIFDRIFLRHGSSGSEYFRLLEEHEQRILLYIPSNTIRENFREKQAATKTSITGLFFRWTEYYWCFYRHEKKLNRQYLNRLRGVVVFTPEFGKILQRQSAKAIRIIYNRDGVDCKNVRVRKPIGQGDTLQLLFMKGSSMLQPWAGLDRLIRSIRASNDQNVKLYITGNVVEKDRYNYPFVELTGRLSEAELESLVDRVDLGVSNLANYLIDFNETTNLKSRDYFARGLPFIQSNTMPDVEGTEGVQFYHLVPNNATLLSIPEIRAFAMRMRENGTHPTAMRRFAETHLDWKETVGELASAIEMSS